MNAPTHIRLFGTVADSIVDGPGLRYAVFVQGCSHACPGCHNPESQPAESGTLTSIDSIVTDVQANKLIQGVTLSGGEPFEQAEACAQLAQRLKALGYNVWAYTGYVYEDLVRMAVSVRKQEPEQLGEQPSAQADAHARAIGQLLGCIDVLVDGPFVETRKSLGLKWRGSSNQRVIDLAATRKTGRLTLWEAQQAFPSKPSSW